MKQDYPVHIPIAGSRAERIFTRQRDEISCGPACLATVAKLYAALGLSLHDEKRLKTYMDFRAAANPSEEVGTPEETVRALCERHLPYESAGARTYHGGVAIADIVQEGEGHYVVFLCKKDDVILYYDPYENELVADKMAHIDWRSGFESAEQWSVNFKVFPDNSFERWLDMAAQKRPLSKQRKQSHQPHT